MVVLYNAFRTGRRASEPPIAPPGGRRRSTRRSGRFHRCKAAPTPERQDGRPQHGALGCPAVRRRLASTCHRDRLRRSSPCRRRRVRQAQACSNLQPRSLRHGENRPCSEGRAADCLPPLPAEGWHGVYREAYTVPWDRKSRPSCWPSVSPWIIANSGRPCRRLLAPSRTKNFTLIVALPAEIAIPPRTIFSGIWQRFAKGRGRIGKIERILERRCSGSGSAGYLTAHDAPERTGHSLSAGRGFSRRKIERSLDQFPVRNGRRQE